MRKLADECHEHGAAVMIQLTHLGRRTAWNKGDWLPVLAPSPIREPAHRGFPKAVEEWDIERIIADYATAAARMQAAGLDGCEIEAYGHLPDLFWSPATNLRDDNWGGSLENRMRFSLRVLKAMREAVGNRFLIGIRMTGDERWDKGLKREEGFEIGRRLAAAGLVDFVNVIRGRIDSDNALLDVIPIMGMPSAPHLDFAGEMRAATGLPVFHAARITDVGHRPACDRRGQARHGRHDTGAHRRPAHRQEDQGRPGAHDPSLRGSHLLPRPHLRGQRGLVRP